MPEEKGPGLIEDPCGVSGLLNAKYFENVLRNAQNDCSIKVQSVDVKYALPKGENYASVIYRARVTFHTKDQCSVSSSFIIKGLPEAEVTKQKLAEYNLHGKEMDVYEIVVPELKRLMRSTGTRSEMYPSALTIDRENKFIVLEDLTPKGHVMANRLSGLDIVHTRMSLKLMAKLHAGSMKMAEQNPTVFTQYTTGMLTRKTDSLYSFFNSNFQALVDEISTWQPEWLYYSNKLRKLKPHFVEQGLRVFDHESKDDLQVLVHGDLWTNNLMFKYDASGKPVDVILIDFQFCCYATPAIDLYYFFFTSTKDDIRQHRFEELMQYYYYHLAGYLKRLNYGKRFPSLHQFQQQLLKKMFHAVFSSFICLPVHLNEVTVDADFEALVGNDARSQRFKRTVMGNQKYHDIIKGLLPMFDRKGLLDKLD